MKNFRLFTLAAIFAALLAFTACEESTDPDDDPIDDLPQPPTELMATSIDDNTIKITWNHSGDQGNNLRYVYRIYDEQDDLVLEDFFDSNFDTYEISGLDIGVAYTIRLYSQFVDTEEMSANPAEVTWSTAMRFGSEATPFRLYTWSTTQEGSGLNMYNAQGDPEVLMVSERNNWDLALYDKDIDSTWFGAASFALQQGGYDVTGMNSITEIGTVVYFGTSLDDVYFEVGLDQVVDLNGTSIVFDEYLFNIDQSAFVNDVGNAIFIVRTKDAANDPWHYARVMLVRDTTDDDFIHGTGADAHIEAVISYNTVGGLPYAK